MIINTGSRKAERYRFDTTRKPDLDNANVGIISFLFFWRHPSGAAFLKEIYMREYKTQMEAARMGIVTPEMKKVAAKERRTEEEIRNWVALGQVAIPANAAHKSLDPNGIGRMLKTKINVNLGVSRDVKDYDVEMEKVMSAVNLGAEAIMDLSSHGNTQPFRRKLTAECPAMIGTVPVYDSVIHYQRDLGELTAKDFIDVVRLHAEDGVDFVTLHCGITKKTIEEIKAGKRKMNIVSRGGSLVFAWMSMTGNENPFYEYYDEILDICREHDVTISLGDACRPGCLSDATDSCQIGELLRLGELTQRAWEKDVQVMVEGPGHVPMDQIAANMKIQETICKGAPFYVLGPLVTDIAPGYDHITAAIGGAMAAMSGAAFLCYVTPAEHLALPNVDDVRTGIIASKIAAHAADIAKGIPGAREQDDRMAEARRKLDWDAQFKEALDPETARAIRDSRAPEDDHSDTCSMCGKFCAVRSMNKALAGENIDIL
jgi:phosphomethylpyrimidine synthase